MKRTLSMLVAATVLGGCPAPTTPSGGGSGGITRADFNQGAARLNLPLFWTWDADENGRPDPDEVAALLFHSTRETWVENGQFTEAFRRAHQAIQEAAAAPGPSAELPEAEQARRRRVADELDQGYPTLVFNDLTGLSEPEKKLLEHLLAAGALIDELYATQNGAAALADRIPADDPASASAFRRNWGVHCLAPRTEGDPACTAAPGVTEQPVDVYPAALQAQDGFCEALAARPDQEALLGPFTVVRGEGDALSAVPYTEAYSEPMKAIAAELRAAADAVESVATEEALRAYLRAAADAFETNLWEPADEAWARMNAENSAWYVRIAPDETYWEPCSRKAGFHLTLARINPASLEWQRKLVPVQQEMESALAELIGAPYAAREVSFHLPDFIDIVTNHGDDRDPSGATIGQSLPNWGPVANEGRGRTVVMTNLYTDPDSLAFLRHRADSLFVGASAAEYSSDQEASLIGTILHEAAHNLGPAHEYEVDGKKDDEAFGGPLASILEELKAQTAALWYLEFLREREIITPEFARHAYANNLAWCFGHISRGMYTDAGVPKTYSQVSAIQIGYLTERGAMHWDAEAPAGNGTDTGAFHVDFEALPAAVEALMQLVGKAKATGDRAAGEDLVRRFVDGDAVPQATIRERVLRDPKASFVYAVTH